MNRDTLVTIQSYPPSVAAPKGFLDLNSNSTDNQLPTDYFSNPLIFMYFEIKYTISVMSSD